MLFSIQEVYAQLKRLSFGRELALSVGPLRGNPRGACNSLILKISYKCR